VFDRNTSARKTWLSALQSVTPFVWNLLSIACSPSNCNKSMAGCELRSSRRAGRFHQADLAGNVLALVRGACAASWCHATGIGTPVHIISSPAANCDAATYALGIATVVSARRARH
jgi:hypothetical protein